MFVLDTDVLSLTSPTSGLAGADVEAWRSWVDRNGDLLFFSAITVMEVRFGIERLVARGATNKSAALKKWLLATETVHLARVIPVTIEIAHRAGELLCLAVQDGTTPSSEDAIVAATADVRGFSLISRNGRHMEALGAKWHDPLRSLPPDRPS